MKITKTKTTKKFFFEKLKEGDVFIFNGNYYLKIPIAAMNDFDLLNAIDLSNWNYTWIEENEEVVIVNAELIIRE